jgi:DNA invertase Pin-like site-specific DNA recombinase
MAVPGTNFAKAGPLGIWDQWLRKGASTQDSIPVIWFNLSMPETDREIPGSKCARRELKAELQAKHIRVVALDLPTSWLMAAKADEFTGRMFEAINSMLLDMLAAVARKDYDDRRRRQAQGQAKAKAEGRYKGRVEDVARNAGIASMLKGGQSWSSTQAATGCSRATIAKIAKRQVKAA